LNRAEIEEFVEVDNYTEVKVKELSLEAGENIEVETMMRLALEGFESYVKLNKKIPEEVLNTAASLFQLQYFHQPQG
jgi:ATP-dependent Lon protease